MKWLLIFCLFLSNCGDGKADFCSYFVYKLGVEDCLKRVGSRCFKCNVFHNEVFKRKLFIYVLHAIYENEDLCLEDTGGF